MRHVSLLSTLIVLAAAFGCAQPQAEAQAKRTAIVGAEIFDATGAKPFTGTVVISGGVIESVTRGTGAPKGVEIINAKGLALLPGLHDVHTHYFSIDRGRYNAAEVNYTYVSIGVTTVADFSQAPEAFAARRAWYAGMPAPHVLAAGRISPWNARIFDWGDPASSYWASTPDAATLAVKALAPYKPDVIKVFTDGWRYGGPVDVDSMDEPTLTALVKQARAQGLPVLTHTLTLERGKIAARAGVSVIAHALQDRPIDQEMIDLALASGTAFGPTLETFEPVKPGDKPPPMDDAFKARLARFDLALANIKALHDAGLKIVVGSDAGSSRNPHGPSTQREIELLTKAGLSPFEAVMAATVNSARAVGQKDTGTIEPGMRADLVLIDGKPWNSISDIRKVARTFVDGKTVYRKGEPRPPTLETPPAIRPASALIADFESPDRRTPAGALTTMDLDRGGERSWEVLNIVPRAGGGRALSAAASMALRPDPYTEIVVPLVKGGVQPVDARAFRGVTFDVRGAGAYGLSLMAPAGAWTAEFKADDAWTTRRIAFSELAAPKGGTAWSGDDLLAVRFRIARPAGESAWLEIDNLAFY